MYIRETDRFRYIDLYISSSSSRHGAIRSIWRTGQKSGSRAGLKHDFQPNSVQSTLGGDASKSQLIRAPQSGLIEFGPDAESTQNALLSTK